MRPSNETDAVHRDTDRLSSEKRSKVGSPRNAGAGGRPSKNVQRRAPLGGVRAVVLSGGVGLAAILALGLASGANWPASLLAACCPGLLSPTVAAQDSPAKAPEAEPTGTIPRVGARAPNASFETAGRSVSIASLHGKKTMLWLLSTWCPSCAQGVLGLAKVQPDLARAGVEILALRNYRNGGYPGPPISQFVQKFGGPPNAPNWTVGEASEQLMRRYNPRGYPDVYFLIDGSGVVRAVSSAPSATIDRILQFAAKGA